MEKSLLNFFKLALDKGVINSNEIDKTTALITAADAILDEALTSNTKLKSKFKNGVIKPECISKISIEENYNNTIYNRPIIDLVQQGGGMYGIALLGYTYIMEKVGIRFYSHGGTSAGGINAMFLAAISNTFYKLNSPFRKDKQVTKSEILTHIIANTDFSKFMDKDGLIGKIQQMLFRNFKSPFLKFLFIFMTGLPLIITYVAFGYIYAVKNGLSGFEIRFYDFIIGTLNVISFTFIIYFLLIKLFGRGFGINKGNTFFKWGYDLLSLLEIKNTKALKVRMDESKVKSVDDPRLILITANLTHNRVVKFPERAGDYWKNPANINPAAYLRATMSLPFIYEAFTPDNKYYDVIQEENGQNRFARFVDGGMLSNFPIREFHREGGKPPRFPTFGVLLSKKDMDDLKINVKNKTRVSLVEYVSSFIKTFRNFYDNDFLFSSEEIQSRVVTVDTKEFNWLDFWMDNNTKKELFVEGAKAAIRQLEKFDWYDYKKIRMTEITENIKF